MPHYFILSPFDEPIAYVAFAIKWVSSFICIAVSLLFSGRKKEAWWLLIALAFSLPLFEGIILSFLHGLPLLPYGTSYPDQQLPPAPHGEYSATFIRTVGVDISWNTVTPVVAIALAWAYVDDKKKRSSGGATAQI